MDISITVITYNRLDYTVRTIESLIKNTVVNFELIVVDNNSTDRTYEFLTHLHKIKRIDKLILNKENMYPGIACNQGWDKADCDAKFICRSDNDLYFNKGWDLIVMKAFEDFPEMGQLGLVNELYQVIPEYHHLYNDHSIVKGKTELFRPITVLQNVGGPCVVRKELVDKGLRWKPDKWNESNNEDVAIAGYVRYLGYEIYELPLGIVEHIGYGDMQTKYKDYYEQTYKDRKLDSWFNYRLNIEKKFMKDGKWRKDIKKEELEER